jgi:hypothetical protein
VCVCVCFATVFGIFWWVRFRVLVFILLVAEAPGGWGQGQGEGEEERRESGGGLLLSSLVTSCGLGDQSRTLGTN